MMYDKLPLILTAIAYIMIQAHAQDWGDTVGDPLSPDFVGDTMSTGMDLGMEQQAKDAGIITGSNSQHNSASGPSTTYLGTPPAGSEMDVSPTTNADDAENANITGAWSIDLSGELTRHIDLNLAQNKNDVMGYGSMTGGNGTQKVTASGSLSGGRLMLTVMPINSLDLYKLDLSLESHTSGTYTAYSASGETWLGSIIGTAPSGISSNASDTMVPDYSNSTGAVNQPSIDEGTANGAATADSVAHLGSGSASLGQEYGENVGSSTSMSMDSSGGSGDMQSISSVSSG